MNIRTLLKKFLIRSVSFYQYVFSPLLGPRCRFYPSCSEYAKACLEKDSLLLSLRKICWRLLRCQPLSAGGLDLP